MVALPSAFFGITGTGAGLTGDGTAPPGDGAGPAGSGAAAAGAASRCANSGGAFIMSIVPLNLGFAAPLMLNPHFWHFALFSSFCVPQFGQNTRLPPIGRIASHLGKASRAYIELACGSSELGYGMANAGLTGGFGLRPLASNYSELQMNYSAHGNAP